MLEDLVLELEQMGIELHLAELKDRVRLKVDRFGLQHPIPPDRVHPTVNDAVRDFRRETGAEWEPPGGAGDRPAGDAGPS
jgi:hypothetical protein